MLPKFVEYGSTNQWGPEFKMTANGSPFGSHIYRSTNDIFIIFSEDVRRMAMDFDAWLHSMYDSADEGNVEPGDVGRCNFATRVSKWIFEVDKRLVRFVMHI